MSITAEKYQYQLNGNSAEENYIIQKGKSLEDVRQKVRENMIIEREADAEIEKIVDYLLKDFDKYGK